MRTERFKSLLPIDRLVQSAVTIIGIGAIGRQVGLQLAAMGVGKIQLIDFDGVEEVNLGPQGYLQDDVGRQKVHATGDLMHEINHMLDLACCDRRFARSMTIHPVVFCCVDSIETRRHIWNAIRSQAEFFVDGRMAAEVARIVTVCNASARQHYPQTLFAESEAMRENCTARSTIYCANVAAGLMVSQFSHWLRGFPVEFDFTLNLLSLELVVPNPSSSGAATHS